MTDDRLRDGLTPAARAALEDLGPEEQALVAAIVAAEREESNQ